jgi:hypothetical protein
MLISSALAELLVFAGGIILNVFVVPTLLDENAAVPRIQSLAFAIALSTVAVGYMVLGLMLPMLSVMLGAILWILVFVYRPTTGKYLGLANLLPDSK